MADNITAFGGDPDAVTIFGESGGGQKVTALLAMPAAGGLFRRAAAQSGCMLRAGVRVDPNELAAAVLAELDVGPRAMDRLHEMDVDRLIGAAGAVMGRMGVMVFSGVVDGVTLPRHPVDALADGAARTVPLLVGTTADEFRMVARANPDFNDLDDAGLRAQLGNVIGRKDTGDFVDEPLAVYRRLLPEATNAELFGEVFTDFAHQGAVATAEATLAGGGAPVYAYLFAYAATVNGRRFGAYHGSELAYLFGNLGILPHTTGPEAEAMAEIVSATWLAFARSGDPGHPGLPDWPAYTLPSRPTMVLDDTSRIELDPHLRAREAWAGVANVR